MTDREKLKKITVAIASFCLFNTFIDDVAKNSKCKPFIDYMEIVEHTTQEIVDILTEGAEIND